MSMDYTRSATNNKFGSFNYRDLEGGKIEVDVKWVKENMITYTLPPLVQATFKVKTIQVHKNSKVYWDKAFSLLAAEPSLLKLIKTFDGVYVTRHIRWDSSKGISNHAWGTAIDLNAGQFPLGTYIDAQKSPNNPNLILFKKVFEPAGFSWGNSYKDPMHFEIL